MRPSQWVENSRDPSSLPDSDVNGQAQAVPAPYGNLGFTVMLFLVVTLAFDDPVFDGFFLESPDVP